MQPARIAELLQPFLTGRSSTHSEPGRSPTEEAAALSSGQLEDISTYIDILLRWNARINLTAIRDPEEIVVRHFGESLFAARHLFPPDASAFAESAVAKPLVRVADIGSGAGFPGIPIKLWAPEIALTLVESNQKKATFLREVVRCLTLTDIDIQNVRAEELAPRPGFDVVTLRAVERFAEVLPTAVSLVAASGRIALLIGSAQLAVLNGVGRVAWAEPVPVPLSRARVLVVGYRDQESKQVE
jgi:16S rRNA (guanine527-N7)-methyltransferase